MKQVFWDSLHIDGEMGVGLATGQGSDPQMMLRYSNDGGHTWSGGLWKTMGAIGKYMTRARWTRLGMARDRVYEVSISDPVFVFLTGAYAEFRAGAN